MLKYKRALSLVVAAGFLAWSACGRADQPSATDVAKEINLVTAAATGVISQLQGKINGASLKETDIDDAVIRSEFAEQFRKLGGGELTAVAGEVRDEIRQVLSESFRQVMTRFRPDMLKGGQDAFVPAFFRAQLLLHFNEKMRGRYQAVVTNRSSELLNRDSSPDRSISDKDMVSYAKTLLEAGDTEIQSKQFGAQLVTYWPMKITEPCAACHQRNGLDQKIGAFGGATLVIVGSSR